MESDDKAGSSDADFVWSLPDKETDGWPAALVHPIDPHHAAVVQHVIDRVREQGFEIVTSPARLSRDAPEFRVRGGGVTWAWCAVNLRSASTIHLPASRGRAFDIPDHLRVNERPDGPRVWLETIDDAEALLSIALPHWST